MSPNTAQTICQILAAVSGCLALLFGFGAYHFGNKADAEKEQDDRRFHEESFESAQTDREQKHEDLTRQLEQAVKELKDFVVSGSKELVDKIPQDADWDLKQGTLFLVASPPSEGSLNLQIASKKYDTILRFEIKPSSITFIYHKPSLGDISKTAQISEADFKDERRLLIIAFLWHIAEERIEVMINGEKRA